MKTLLLGWLICIASTAAVTKPASASFLPANGYHAPLIISDTVQQENSPFSKESLGTFDSCFAAIADRYKVTLLCEGMPYTKTLTEEQIKTLSEKVSNSTSQLELAAIAAAYDYTVEWQSSSLCLLRKRYTNPDDLPDVPITELIGSLKNISRLWGLNEEGSDEAEAVDALANALTPEWSEKLAAHGAAISEMPQDIRALVHRFLYVDQVSMQLRGVSSIAFCLQQCAQGKATFRKNDLLNTGVAIPVYEGELYRYRGQRYQAEVALSFVAITTGGAGATAIFAAAPPDPKQLKQQTTESLVHDPALNYLFRDVVDPPASAITIGKYIARQADEGSRENLTVECDSVIADKHLCVFGEANSTPEAINQGIADLYGLRIATTEKKTRLTAPGVRVQNDLAALAGETQRLLPLPLRNYLSGSWRQGNGDPGAAQHLDKRAPELYRAAMARLRARADKAIARSSTGQIPITDMPSGTLDLVGISNFAASIHDIEVLQEPLPSYLLDQQNTTLQIRFTADPTRPSGFRETHSINTSLPSTSPQIIPPPQ